MVMTVMMLFFAIPLTFAAVTDFGVGLTPPPPPKPPSTLLPFEYKDYPGVNINKVIDTGDGGGAQLIVASLQKVFRMIKQMLGPLLVFFIVGVGIQLVISQGEEEKFNAAMRNFKYLLAGTAIVIFSERLADLFSLYNDKGSTFLSTPDQMTDAQKTFRGLLDTIIIFIRYLLGGVAVFYVVKSGLAIILSADEETVSKQKEVFLYGFAGVVLIMISESLVRVVFHLPPVTGENIGVFFQTPKLNVEGGTTLVTSVTNMLLAAMGGLFLFTLVVGGALYTFSAGNEERGKKGLNIIIGSLLGLVIALSAYTVVAEFSRKGGGINQAEVKAPSTLDLDLNAYPVKKSPP